MAGDEPVDGLNDEFEFLQGIQVVAKVDGRHKARGEVTSPNVPTIEVVFEADRACGVFVGAFCPCLDDGPMEFEGLKELDGRVGGDGSIRSEETESTEFCGDVDLADILDVLEGSVGRDLAVDQIVDDGKTDREVRRKARVEEDFEQELFFVFFLPVVVGKRGTVSVDLTEPAKKNRKFVAKSLLMAETNVGFLEPLQLDPVIVDIMAIVFEGCVFQEGLETSRDLLSTFLGEERWIGDVADRKESWTEGRVDGRLLLELFHHVWHKSVPQLAQILVAPQILDQTSVIV